MSIIALLSIANRSSWQSCVLHFALQGKSPLNNITVSLNCNITRRPAALYTVCVNFYCVAYSLELTARQLSIFEWDDARSGWDRFNHRKGRERK